MDDVTHYIDPSIGSAVHDSHDVFGSGNWTVIPERVTCKVCISAMAPGLQRAAGSMVIDGMVLKPGMRILVKDPRYTQPRRWSRRWWRWMLKGRPPIKPPVNGIYRVGTPSTWLKP